MPIDRYTDPECQAFLAGLRHMTEWAGNLKDRIDAEEPFVGCLWTVAAHLRSALNATEEKLTPNVEE